ncbi:MAG: type II secretion system F family protein [Candidatus Nanopelagicales bacterium]
MNQLLTLGSITAIVIAAISLLALVALPSKRAKGQQQLVERVQQYAPTPHTGVTMNPSVITRLRVHGEHQAANVPSHQGWSERLGAGLMSAGMTLKPEEFLLLSATGGFVGGLGLFLLAHASIPAGILGAAIGLAVPAIVLRLKASRRQARFVTEMPDMLTALASGLSAGAALGQALESVASESTGPMGDELNRVIIESRLGTSVPDALEATSERMHCPDLGLVVMAMRLQGMHGGNLSELLNTVAATLRERVQMQRHVRALSAEGRMSLMVLMALPVLVLAFIAVVRPEYFHFFISTVIGMMMLGLVAIMMLCGYLWARTIVNVEV